MIYICARSTRDKQNKSTQDNVCACVRAQVCVCVCVVLEMLCVWWVGGSGCGCTASIQMHIYCGCSCCGACCCFNAFACFTFVCCPHNKLNRDQSIAYSDYHRHQLLYHLFHRNHFHYLSHLQCSSKSLSYRAAGCVLMLLLLL